MFIAEIGINHNGSLESALEMISKSKEAGADVVKFQKRNPDVCVPESQKSVIKHTPWGDMKYIDYKHRIEFTKHDYECIDSHCKNIGITWTASVWDIDSLNFILEFDVPFIKIASASITDMKLLEAVRATGKDVIMSTGMSYYEEIYTAYECLSNNCKVSILHCNSSYPTLDKEINLNNIISLKELFSNAIIGYSGHEEGIYPSLVAKSMGAEIIERHVTLDKSKWGSDQKASISFDELKELTTLLNNVDTWKGSKVITVYESEVPVRSKLRK